MENGAQQPQGMPLIQSLPGVAELLRKAWERLQQNFRAFASIGVAALVAQIIMSLAAVALLAGTLVGGLYGLSQGNTTVGVGLIVSSIFVLLVLLVLYAFVYAWVQAAYILRIKGEVSSTQSLFQLSKQWVMPLWWVCILAGIMILIGTVLFIIPGIIFAVWYSFISFIVVIEGVKGNQALQKSKSYVQGYWWPVFGRLVLVGIVIGIASSILNAIFGNINSTLGSIVSSAASIFIFVPFGLSYQYEVYTALKAIKSKGGVS
jgi:hypothetical protein